MKKYKKYNPDQTFLMPPSLREWLPEGHLVYFLSDIVDQMDMSCIEQDYERSDKGQPPYDPRMMVKIIFYGYCTGVVSSRRIEKATYEDMGFRVLAAGHHPDHDTIAEFRKRFLGELAELFKQVLMLCQEVGLVRLGHVALDGTKVKANASKHKAMSYEGMGRREEELKKIVEKLLKEAERVDEEEDGKYGKGKLGDDLPDELKFHESRLKKIREAKKALEEEAKRKAERKKEGKGQEEAVEVKEGDQEEEEEEVAVEPKTQRNFTDPESRIMRDSATREFIQGYNAQVAVDDRAQVIVACDVVQEANDRNQLEPMVEQVIGNTGGVPDELSADAGYFSEENIRYLQTRGIDAYIPPWKIKHGDKLIPSRGRIPKDASCADRMRRKLSTEIGKKKYSKRKEVVEPVNGQIKEIRGFRRFLFRGLQNVQAEWKIICLTHNILKLFRFFRRVEGVKRWGMRAAFA